MPAPLMVSPLDVTFGDAYARGAVRVFKQRLHQRWTQLDRAFHSERMMTDGASLLYRGSAVGRSRAWKRVSGIMTAGGAVSELPDLDKQRRLYHCWSVLKPRERMIIGSGDPAMEQNCVGVNYWMLLPGHTTDYVHWADGLWTLEVPDHALGRLVQRTGRPELLEPAIREAHRRALCLSAEWLPPYLEADRVFLLPAGPGVFMCRFVVAHETTTNSPQLHIQVITWLHRDMLHDNQTLAPLVDNVDQSLGLTWLLPYPLRRIEVENGELVLSTLDGKTASSRLAERATRPGHGPAGSIGGTSTDAVSTALDVRQDGAGDAPRVSHPGADGPGRDLRGNRPGNPQPGATRDRGPLARLVSASW